MLKKYDGTNNTKMNRSVCFLFPLWMLLFPLQAWESRCPMAGSVRFQFLDNFFSVDETGQSGKGTGWVWGGGSVGLGGGQKSLSVGQEGT